MIWSLLRDGFEIRSSVLPATQVNNLVRLFDELITGDTAVRLAGRRNLLRLPLVATLATELKPLVAPALGPNAFAVRGLFFDKLPGANWQVGWHQDLSIAVAERVETPGFSGWSVKKGVVHVQPPAFVLEQMLSVRVHLDDCGAENGPLRVVQRFNASTM
jgi:hypothetical protein